MKRIVIVIATQESIRAHVCAIASGKRELKAGEQQFGFTSMRSLTEVLSDDNPALWKLVCEDKSESLSRLDKFSGRAPSNLSAP